MHLNAALLLVTCIYDSVITVFFLITKTNKQTKTVDNKKPSEKH